MSKAAIVVFSKALANPDHRLHWLYLRVDDKVSGVCRFCARAYGVYDQAEALGLPFLAVYGQHPRLRTRVAERYQVIPF